MIENKKALFSLQENRKFDFSHFKAMKIKEICKKNNCLEG